MRFTGSLVHKIGMWVQETTDGAIRNPQQGGDLGYGARYIHGEQMKVWLGRYGAREAAAYYAAVSVKWAELSGTDAPEWVAEMHEVLSGGAQPASVHLAGVDGTNDADAKYPKVSNRTA